MLLIATRNEPNQSAATIVQDARRRLMRSQFRVIRGLSCDYHEGILFLRGRVFTYYQKQLAQEAVRNVAGVDKIVNAIAVQE